MSEESPGDVMLMFEAMLPDGWREAERSLRSANATVATLTRDLAAARERWRSMDSAPRDGTLVLLHFRSSTSEDVLMTTTRPEQYTRAVAWMPIPPLLADAPHGQGGGGNGE